MKPDSHSDCVDDRLARSGDARIVEAVKQYMTMLEQGTAPPPSEYVRAYPGLETELLPSLEGLCLIYLPSSQTARAASDIQSAHHSGKNLGPAALLPVGPSVNLPEKLGDFRILREIGRGGMGIVYEAEQLSLNRRVALKVLSFASAFDVVRLQRFRNEAQAAAGLHHSHIVPVYAVGTDRGVHYYAMQYIEGHTLADLVEELRQGDGKLETTPMTSGVGIHAGDEIATLPARRDSTLGKMARSTSGLRYRMIARMMIQASEGLSHAHQYGIVHRDIKPANLILDNANNIWVTDFGLAQVQNDSNLTRTGDMLGTLRYMSPEQSSGGNETVDHRTDIYSLGATLYELLTLRPAIEAQGYKQILAAIADREPDFPCDRDASIPRELAIIACKALAKRPIDRYQSAQEVAEDLQRWLDDKPILAKPLTMFQRMARWRRRHTGLVNAAGVFGLLAAVGFFFAALLIYREQQKTSQALAQEILQRQASEVRYQQAKRAVDTFTEIVESELAYRPDLISVRREFLDASLEFYQDFLDAKQFDVAAQHELSENADQFKRLLSSLELLNKIEPIPLLEFAEVRSELSLTSDQWTAIQAKLSAASPEFSAARPIPETATDKPSEGLQAISQLLTEPQWKRLFEIHRQMNVPFTFKNYETWVALKLTREQRKGIGRIIEEERPDLAAKRNGLRPAFYFPGSEPFSPSGPPRRGDRRGERGPRPDSRGPYWQPPPPHQMHMPGTFDGPFSDDMAKLIRVQTEKTVARILDLLTEEQRLRWGELRGAPFRFSP
jgi:eukaryotic-like serine/threonine-protein kinase